MIGTQKILRVTQTQTYKILLLNIRNYIIFNIKTFICLKFLRTLKNLNSFVFFSLLK